MIVHLILIPFVILIISTGIIYVLFHRDKYLIQINFYDAIIVFFVIEIIFFFSFISFTIPSHANEIKLIFYKIALISHIAKIGYLSSIHCYFLLEGYFRYISPFIYTFLGGIILSIVLASNSVDIISLPGYDAIIIQSFLLL